MNRPVAIRDLGSCSSGWELHAPDETEEKAGDPSRVRLPALSWLMQRYPAFGELVRSGARDGGWDLDPDSGRYV